MARKIGWIKTHTTVKASHRGNNLSFFVWSERQQSSGNEKLDLKFHLEMSHVFMSNWWQSGWKKGRQKVIISQCDNCKMHYRASTKNTSQELMKTLQKTSTDIPYSAKFDNDDANSLRKRNLPQLSCWLLTISFHCERIF